LAGETLAGGDMRKRSRDNQRAKRAVIIEQHDPGPTVAYVVDERMLDCAGCGCWTELRYQGQPVCGVCLLLAGALRPGAAEPPVYETDQGDTPTATFSQTFIGHREDD